MGEAASKGPTQILDTSLMPLREQIFNDQSGSPLHQASQFCGCVKIGWWFNDFAICDWDLYVAKEVYVVDDNMQYNVATGLSQNAVAADYMSLSSDRSGDDDDDLDK